MAPAAFASLLPATASASAAASRLPSAAAAAGGAASFARLPRHPAGWAGASVVAAPRTARRRAPGIAYATAATEKSIYDYTVKDIDGKDVPLKKFKNRVLLIVNVASQWTRSGEVIASSFESECRVLRSIRHRNLIRVITACSAPDFKAVVLPFMPNGSLDGLIHGPPGGGKPEGPHQLDLDLLLSIAGNVAEGMAYLHHHAPIKVVHCDLKPSNVLLDGDMTAVVSDFGISKLVTTDARDPDDMGEASTSICNSITRLLQGSVGYIAPEYGLGGRPSTQGDVYSFGVMLLEMISGKRPTDVISKEGHGLHDWAKNRCLRHDEDAAAVERSPLRSPPSAAAVDRPQREMEVIGELLELGVACSQLVPSMRPTMDDVADEIACLSRLV